MLKRILPFLGTSLCACAFGGLFIFLFANATEVACTRRPDAAYNCQVRRLLLGQWQTSAEEVVGVVDVVMVNDSCDEGCSDRAEFVTNDGRQVPVNSVYTTEGVVERQVSELDVQIAAGAEAFDYGAESPLWVLFLIVGLTVMVIGIGSLSLFRRK